MATSLIRKCAKALRRFWRWRDHHYDVVEHGVVGGGAHFSVPFRAEAPSLDVDVKRREAEENWTR